MPRGGIMLQFEAIQYFAGFVSDAPSFEAEVFEFLDGDNVTVLEIAVEKWGGILASNALGVVPMLSVTPFARLRRILWHIQTGAESSWVVC
jgi:hypothetical protein